jgi:hypothetical protein
MKKENDFFDKPGNIRLLKILSYICLAIVVAVDFFISREHAHYPCFTPYSDLSRVSSLLLWLKHWGKSGL